MTSHRKLAAILCADVSGYSRLMADDERATVDTLQAYRRLITDKVERHGGRVVNAPGDALLAEFPSVVEAVEGAKEIQQELARRNAQLAEHRRMLFRFGINLGDVIEETDGTLYGDGVNIAARLEALAEPGGICVSENVFQQIDGKLPLSFIFIGEQQVKNIPKPVRAYRAAIGSDATSPLRTKSVRVRRLAVAGALVVAAVTGIVAMLVTTSTTTNRPLSTKADPLLVMPTGPTIAVLPFTNMSGDAKQEYFSDGIAEDIITGLSRFRDLFVIARNSTFQYKGRAVDVREVGKALGARYVLEGSVRRTPQRVRVTAQLLNATNGVHLWADTYDRDLTTAEVFDIQDDITTQVVAKVADPLGGTISKAGLEDVKRKGNVGINAYECVLKAKAYFASFDPTAHGQARDCLEQATRSDPTYADAWAWLGLVYVDEHAFGYNPKPDALPRSLEASRRAIELDGSNQMAHWFLARALFFKHDLEQALAETQIAIDLNPNNATVLAGAANYVSYAGHWERGKRLIDRAIVLNPYPPGWYYLPRFWYHYQKGEYAEALAAAQKVGLPGFLANDISLTAAYGQLDRRAEAQEAAKALVKAHPEFPTKVREELQKYNLSSEVIEKCVEGLRKAGMNIPDA